VLEPQVPSGWPAPTETMPPELLSIIVSMLAGAGFDKVAGGVNKLAQSGQNIAELMQMPNMPFVLAGAGLKDSANSMELIGPLLKLLQPPKQEEQQDPQQIAAALSMLAAPLGPGLSGVRPPAGGPGLPPGGPPQGPPQGIPQGPPQGIPQGPPQGIPSGF